MPVVPTSPGPRIPLQPLRVPQLSPNAPREAFGGGIAAERGTLGNLQPAIQGAEAIGAEQARMAYQEKARADQVAVTDVGGKLAQYRTDALYANQNGVDQTGWLGLDGKNSFDMPEKAQTEFWQVADVMRNSLTNEDQKAAFDKIAQGEWDQMHQQIQVHVGKQRVVYDNESTQGALDAKMDQAIKAYNDPSIVEPAIHARASIIQLHGQRNGLPQDFIDTQVAKATSDLRLDVVQQYIDHGQGNAAVAYVEQHKADFVGKALNTAEKLAHQSSVETDALHYADVITGKAPAPEGSPVHAVDESQAYDEAAKIPDADTRIKATAQLRLYYNDRASTTRHSEDTAYQKGQDTLRSNGWNMLKVPLTLRHAMGPTHERELMNEAEHQQKLEQQGGIGDDERMQEIRNEAYWTPEAFAARQLNEPTLNRAQMKEAQSLQRLIGGRFDREAESDIQKVITRADADARHYKGLAEKAQPGSEDQIAAQTAQREAEDKAIFARQDLEAHRTKTATAAPSSGAVIRGGPASSGATIRGGGQPASPESGAVVPSATNPVGLKPIAKTAPTPSMMDDAFQHPKEYIPYLEHMGVDMDAVAAGIKERQAAADAEAAAQAAKGKPKKPVRVERDSSGRASRLVPED